MGEPRKLRCKAKRSGDGQPCKSYAMAGQLVCARHGGMAPQNRAAAAVRIEEDKAKRELARLELEPVTNALEALQHHAAVVVAWRDRCAEMVNKLEERIRFESSLKIEQLRSEVTLWERALDRATVTLSALARAQVDERLAAISQRKADMMAAALSAALQRAGLTSDQAATVRKDFAKRLVVIHAGDAA